MSNAISIITLVAGVVGLGIILWAVKTGDADRDGEDDARAFFEEHGHWPDQTPEEAEAIRAAFRRAAPITVSEPDEHGRV